MYFLIKTEETHLKLSAFLNVNCHIHLKFIHPSNYFFKCIRTFTTFSSQHIKRQITTSKSNHFPLYLRSIEHFKKKKKKNHFHHKSCLFLSKSYKSWIFAALHLSCEVYPNLSPCSDRTIHHCHKSAVGLYRPPCSWGLLATMLAVIRTMQSSCLKTKN